MPAFESVSFSVVVIDSSPLRERAWDDYETVCRRLARGRSRLAYYHEKEVPLFQQWVQTHYGGLLAQLRELAARLQTTEALIQQVEQVAVEQDIPCARAYHKVEQVRARESAQPPPPTPHYQAFAPSHDRPPVQEDLKRIYRALVRRLHPDLQGPMNPLKKERWMEVQIAYNQQDGTLLEFLLRVCEAEEKGAGTGQSIAFLRRVTQEQEQVLQKVFLELKQCRKMPAWDFASRKDLRSFGYEWEHKLRNELASLQLLVAHAEQQIALWRRAGTRSQTRRRHAAWDQELPF